MDDCQDLGHVLCLRLIAPPIGGVGDRQGMQILVGYNNQIA